MTFLIINNYPDPKNMGHTTIDHLVKTLDNLTDEPYSVVGFREFDPSLHVLSDVRCLILSGAPAGFTPQEVEMYRTELEYLSITKLPVLGICHGHQLIAKAHGSNVLRGSNYILGFEKIKILEPDILFSDWKSGDRITVREVHQDYIEDLPKDFQLLATSETCKVEAFKHRHRPLFGVQFHPEVTQDEETDNIYPSGLKILKNFLRYVGLRIST